MFKGATHRRKAGNVFSIFLVAFHRTIAQAESESCIRRLGEAALVKAGFGDECAIAAGDRVNLVVELLACSESIRFDRSHGDDKRVGAGSDRSFAAFI